MKNLSVFLLALLISLSVFTSCSADSESTTVDGNSEAPTEQGSDTPSGNTEQNGTSDTNNGSSAQSTEAVQEAVTNTPNTEPVKNEEIVITEKSAEVKFNGASVEYTGDGVTVSGSAVTVNAPGTYVFTGTSSDGRITVNVDKTAEVKLIFNGLSLTCANSAPVYIMSSEKTVIELADGSANILTDGAAYTDQNAESEPNAALFSKDDLTIKGNGSLTVNGNFNNGITSKNDLKIKSGKITVTAVHDAIRGKDSVEIEGGEITAVCDGDGIKAYEADQDGKSVITLTGGQINITAGQDGIQTDKTCTVNGSTLTIKTGGGSQNSSDKDSWGSWGGGSTSSTSTELSAKGIKANEKLEILSGNVLIDSSDDSLHSNGTAVIGGGVISLSSGDDGIHADTEVTVSNGQIDIKKSYEGIEATTINIAGGTTNIVASDDGINAAGGNDGSAMNRPGMGGFSSGVGALNITGGYLYMNASGDGLDSNGTVTMSGGEVYVDGPTNGGNGPLDYDSSFSVTGGSLVAVGSVGMAQNVSSSTQGAVLLAASGSAGQKIEIKDSNGNVILSHTPAKQYQCALISHPDLKQGQTYTVTVNGSTVQTVTFTQNVTNSGVSGGGMQPGGMQPGGMQPGGRPTRP